MTVKCATHGEQEGAFVCTHVVQTVDDGVARGFTWEKDHDGDHQAQCDVCHDNAHKMNEAQWEEYVAKIGAVLCLQCFWRAWELNGKPTPGHHHH